MIDTGAAIWYHTRSFSGLAGFVFFSTETSYVSHNRILRAKCARLVNPLRPEKLAGNAERAHFV